MIRRIVLTGPESTGKSTLAATLAKHYHTVWVPEFARAQLERLGRPYEKQDLLDIAKGQMQAEDEMMKKAKHMIFCDTDLTVVKIWYRHRYGHVHPFILENLEKRRYDLYLMPYIDLPWKYDPQREHPHLRAYFFNLYEKELNARGIGYTIIRGQEKQRFESAVEAVESARKRWM